MSPTAHKTCVRRPSRGRRLKEPAITDAIPTPLKAAAAPATQSNQTASRSVRNQLPGCWVDGVRSARQSTLSRASADSNTLRFNSSWGGHRYPKSGSPTCLLESRHSASREFHCTFAATALVGPGVMMTESRVRITCRICERVNSSAMATAIAVERVTPRRSVLASRMEMRGGKSDRAGLPPPAGESLSTRRYPNRPTAELAMAFRWLVWLPGRLRQSRI